MIIMLFFIDMIILKWKKTMFSFSNFHYEKNDNKLQFSYFQSLFIIIQINNKFKWGKFWGKNVMKNWSINLKFSILLILFVINQNN